MDALGRLKETAGRRDVMRSALLLTLDKLEAGKGGKLQRFAERVRNILLDLHRIGNVTALETIDKVLGKLPVTDRQAWNEGKVCGVETRDLKQFGSWLCARAATYQSASEIAAEQLNQGGKGRHARSNANQQRRRPERDPDREPFCFSCHKTGHRLEDCESFGSLTAEERSEFCGRHRLCYGCLAPGHPFRRCRKATPCKVEGCRRRHHTLLHEEPAPRQEPAPKQPPPSSSNSHSATTQEQRVALGVIKVYIRGRDGRPEEANLLLDEGSDSTLVRDGLLRRLGVQGITHQLNLHGVTGTHSAFDSQRVTLLLEPYGEKPVRITASSVPKVCEPIPTVAWQKLKNNWAHLADLPLQESGGRIDILLGLDHAHLMLPTESRAGKPHEPCGIRTKLGWIVRGVIGGGRRLRTGRANLLVGQQDQQLDADFKRFCNAEDFGTMPETVQIAPEDQKAVELVETGLKRLAVGYEAALPWRDGEPSLVNNRPQAEFRLRSLMKRFTQDPVLEDHYRVAMKKYFESGYVSKVQETQLFSNDQYLLCHHGVYKKHGDPTKLRIVFDSAAKFKGKCLNDALFSGPPLQNQLPSVLIKFREGAVAFTADIEAMFSRIRLRPEDARYHRFLWMEKGSADVSTYQIDRLTFGDRCSPFVAIKTVQRVANDFGEGKPEAVEALKSKLYMDDYLDSSKEVDEGIRRAKEVQWILRQGDFHLKGWASNSEHFTAAFDQKTVRAEDGQHQPLADDETTKILGVGWKPKSDSLTFTSSDPEIQRFTLRALASLTAGVFDPLGLASPMIIKAKIKLRELDTRGLDWPDQVSEEQQKWWEEWIALLSPLRNITLPRCLFPEEEKIIRTELHTFSDDSEEALAAAVYLRQVYPGEKVAVRLVMAKTKLAQKKTISIPKLELNAALLAARLSNFVQKSMTRPIKHRRFWTDSSCVRNWVRSTAAFYKPYVSHRVGEIQTLTESSKWRFIPGRLNISDGATRSGLTPEQPLPENWIDGPPFLHQPEEEWPKDIPWIAVGEELRANKQARTHLNVTTEPPVNWADVKIEPSYLSHLMLLEEPYLQWIKRCQWESFAEDIHRLKKGKNLKPVSRLLSLSPSLDEKGLLRMGGRLGNAELSFESLHPVFLPAKHPLTEQIIDAYHQKLLYTGTELVLAHIRQHFWIVNGKEAVRRARSRCPTCVQDRVQPATQLMADRHESRVDLHCKPFTRTAVDYFGPMEIEYGRGRTAKRYGALFTCMTTRANYVELALSLSAEDFLLVFRRFIGLYTQPKIVHSDNGTNFVAAEKELLEPVRQLHQSPELMEFNKKLAIDWKFQPPGAPHFGGAHESMVRCVKQALYKALEVEKTRAGRPTHEMLRTLLFEVSGICNTRPLTPNSADPADFRALTPNDFLNRAPTIGPPPLCSYDDALPAEHYRYTQKLTDRFWYLFDKIYLKSLASRKKWRSPKPNLQPGQAVLIQEPNLPRGQWKIARITQVFPGKDGLVRVARVKTEKGETYLRPVHRLCPLELESSTPKTP